MGFCSAVSNTAGMLPLLALQWTSAASITTAPGATLDFHHGLQVRPPGTEQAPATHADRVLQNYYIGGRYVGGIAC